MHTPVLKLIRLDKLNKSEPTTRTKRSAFARLATSVQSLGLLVPPLVRALGRGEYVIIAGEGRVEALRHNGAPPNERIPCLLLDVDDEQAALLGLVENAVREPLSAYDEARLAHMLVRDYRWTQQRIADAMGITQPNVSTLIAIFELDPRVLAALRRGHIDVAHARALLPLRNDKPAQRNILQQVLTRELNATATAALVAAIRHGPNAIPPAHHTIANAGTIDARTTRSGRIRITLEAPDRQALRRLLQTARKKYG